MARQKNALTGYFVGELGESDPMLELAKLIYNVNPDGEEQTEDSSYYDGDGSMTTDVLGVTKSFTFEGWYDETDPAMKFIAGLEFAIGDARKVQFKQVRTDGSSLTGPATVSNINVTGGAAEEYAPFTCTITWDSTPTITPGTPQG